MFIPTSFSIDDRKPIRYDDIGGWVRSVRHNEDRWKPDDVERARRDWLLQGVFLLLQSTLDDATLALEQFQQGNAQVSAAMLQWQAEMERWKEGYPNSGTAPMLDDTYLRRVPVLAGRSFVFALDTIERCIQSIAAEAWAPAGLKAAEATWKVDFENVRKIRDSIHHVDERIRGLTRGKAMPAGMIVLDSISGDTYVATGADGVIWEIDIIDATLQHAADLLTQAVEAYDRGGYIAD